MHIIRAPLACSPEVAARLKSPEDLLNETWLYDAVWADDWDRWLAQAAPGLKKKPSTSELLDWLKAEAEGKTARILTNARCLSEGVDVPALDAIMFLHPRKSLIDVVQSVGGVMRRAEGKKMGYVILPIGVPAGVEPEVALRDNERYRVVWQILNALRAHDERFDGTINQASLGQDVSNQIEIVGVSHQKAESTRRRVET